MPHIDTYPVLPQGTRVRYVWPRGRYGRSNLKPCLCQMPAGVVGTVIQCWPGQGVAMGHGEVCHDLYMIRFAAPYGDHMCCELDIDPMD